MDVAAVGDSNLIDLGDTDGEDDFHSADEGGVVAGVKGEQVTPRATTFARDADVEMPAEDDDL